MRVTTIVACGASVALLVSAAPVAAQEAPSPAANPPSTPDVAERPLLKQIPPPALAFELGTGLTGYLGGTAATGPALNARVTAAFGEHWAAEAGYLGSLNYRHDIKSRMVLTEIDASMRYNLSHADSMPVQPFLTAGLGYAGFSGPGGDRAALVVPVGAGLERMLTKNIKAAARFNYRPVFGEDLRNPADKAAGVSGPGGDTWALLLGVGGGF